MALTRINSWGNSKTESPGLTKWVYLNNNKKSNLKLHLCDSIPEIVSRALNIVYYFK